MLSSFSFVASQELSTNHTSVNIRKGKYVLKIAVAQPTYGGFESQQLFTGYHNRSFLNRLSLLFHTVVDAFDSSESLIRVEI